MSTLSLHAYAPAALRDVMLPKEHGSWSLAFEPLALALLLAPSMAGLALAVAIAAGFFARRPLRLLAHDADDTRRSSAAAALGLCAVIALAGCTVAVALAGSDWIGWLGPSVLAAGVFIFFDLQKAGREQAAEVAGAASFAWLPAAFAIQAGWAPAAASAAGAAMLIRAVPTVLSVRASIRQRKTGDASPAPSVAAAIVALGAAVAFARAGLVPTALVVLAAVLALRTVGLLVFPRPALRARTVGFFELGLGVAFVVACAATWPRAM